MDINIGNMIVFMGVVISILYPIGIFKIFENINKKYNKKLYFLIAPICIFTVLFVPYLIVYLTSPNIVFNFEEMLNFSLKTGLAIFFVIPASLVSIICTIVGYLK